MKSHLRKLTVAAGLGACLLTAGTAHADWYLMAPSVGAINAPLSSWSQLENTFNSANACEAGRQSFIGYVEGRSRTDSDLARGEAIVDAAKHSVCVAYDPRAEEAAQ
jgi:hypothetical protein